MHSHREDNIFNPLTPEPPTETHQLSFKGIGPIRTNEEASQRLAEIETETKELSKMTQPLRKHLRRLYKRISALNRQRHQIQVWLAAPIFTQQSHIILNKPQQGHPKPKHHEPSWHTKKRTFGPVRNKAELASFIKTLDLDELADFAAHLDSAEKKLKKQQGE